MSILRHRRLAGLAALAVPITALVIAVLVLTWGHGSGDRVTADDSTNPATGLDISMAIEGEAGCDTTGGDTKCTLDVDQVFTLAVSVNSLPDKIDGYEGFDVVLAWEGVTTNLAADAESWPDCTFEAIAYIPPAAPHTGAAIGCAAFGSVSTYLGVIATDSFTCTSSGSITLLGAGQGETGLALPPFSYQEGVDDVLTINCGTAPPPDTPTVPAPATPTPCDPVEGCPTDTPVPPTNTPTNTPIPPTPTMTPEFEMGDVNCDGKVNSMDALWVLWLVAGVVDELPCPEAADVNEDGVVNAIDATLILQKDAGLITSLPV